MAESFAGTADDEGVSLSHLVDADGFGMRCLVSGELTNIPALARELELPRATSADIVVASGYRRWGGDVLARLRGRFALLLWNQTSREGLIAVDQLGAGSLFYTETHGGLSFATELRELLDLLPTAPAPDDLAVAQWVADGALQRGRTLYAGVQRLTGGSAISWRGATWSVEQYWSPRYIEPLRGSRDDLAAALREQIEVAVRRRIGDAELVGTLLSGGLDSSVVAAVAASIGPSAAYSMTFPDHPSVDESQYIDFLTQRLDVPSRRIELQEGSLLAPALEFMRRWRWPSISPSLFPNLAACRAAAADGVGVLFDGEDGDGLFGAPPYLIADAIRRGRLPTALHLAKRFSGAGERPPRRLTRWLIREYGVKGIAPRGLHVAARRVRGVQGYALPWLTEQAQRMLSAADDSWDWKSTAGPRWWAHRVDQLTAWRERLGAHDYLRRKSAMAGVHDGHPFLDDLDLVEFVLRLPPEQSFDAHLNRPLLREAMKGVLPDEIRLRPHKATFNEFVEACLDGSDREPLLELVGPESHISAYVRADIVLSTYLAPPKEQRPAGWAGTVWRLATAECWLRSQAGVDVPLGPASGRPFTSTRATDDAVLG